ncbi:radical SAM/Cys-rich domain protein [bacterium]|nr:MAG: radical SAM/Cys-rich domain protein [bacterium]
MRFEDALAAAGSATLKPGDLTVLQLNLGKLCNMTCAHCHVDAGPHRTEVMTRETMEACLRVLEACRAEVVDVTGGAPELNAHFRWLVDECRARGARVMDRCNLSVLLTAGRTDLPEWLAAREVEVVASLPHYRRRNTDRQRGDGAFDKSLEALRRLNRAGYGQGDPKRRLSLVCNPVGAFLAPPQAEAEAEWKRGLREEHGIAFDRLIALNNMPISRYLAWLEASGNLDAYMSLLVNSFNPAAIEGLMCRNTLSVSWDGRLYDCDFNQMLELESRPAGGRAARLADFDPAAFAARDIVVGRHCFGCTAGAGSSCGGALA